MIYVAIISMWVVAISIFYMIYHKPKPKIDLDKEFFDYFMETFNDKPVENSSILKRLRANEIVNELKGKRKIKIVDIKQELIDYHIYLEKKKGNDNPNIKWIGAFVEQYLEKTNE